MKTFNPDNFPDFLHYIPLTSGDIIDQIKDYKLTFINVRNRLVEWGMKIPMFVDSFYDYILKYKKVPNQKVFFQYYLLYNKNFFEGNSLNQDIMEGIQARCFRTYPSLVRDVYFNKLVSESIPSNYHIIYNLNLDVKEGIDMLIITPSKVFLGINLYTDTTRAYQGRAKKTFRHEKFDNVTYVEFPVSFKGSLNVGDFFLYGKKELTEILNMI